MTMKMLAMTVAGVAAVALISSGCGKKPTESLAEKLMEKAIEKDGGGKASVDLSKGKVSIKTKEGDVEFSSGSSVKLPEGFPKDVYVDSGAELKMAMRNPGGYMVTLTTKADKAKIFEKYASEMKSQGWEEKASFNAEGQLGANYEKDGRATMVMITGSDDETQVTLSVRQKDG